MPEVRLIYGPPGTGKTTELLRILDKELETTSPSNIAFVSFTREGVEQGKRRAKERYNLPEEAFPYFRTLHSMAFRANGLSVSSVIQKKDYAAFSKKVGMHFTGYYTEDFKNNDDMYLHYDTVYRNTPSASEFFLDYLDAEKLRFVQKNFKLFKQHYGIYDYTDMIEKFVATGKAVPVTVAMIDEAQDLTALQWKMVWTAFSACRVVYIVGDDDQAIYQWSGADVPYFLSLEGESRILRQSYRVPNQVWKVASYISAQIKSRVVKRYHSTEEEGTVDYSNTIDEIVFEPNTSYMIVSRNDYFLKTAVERLQQLGIVYRYKGKASVNQNDISIITKYEECRRTKELDPIVQAKMKKGATLEDPWYEALRFEEEYATYIRKVISAKRDIKSVVVSTIHGVKGGEADHVILFTDVTKRTYQNMQHNPDSEHRVFYVGVTRAKHRLTIIYPSTRYHYPIIDRKELETYVPD